MHFLPNHEGVQYNCKGNRIAIIIIRTSECFPVDSAVYIIGFFPREIYVSEHLPSIEYTPSHSRIHAVSACQCRTCWTQEIKLST